GATWSDTFDPPGGATAAITASNESQTTFWPTVHALEEEAEALSRTRAGRRCLQDGTHRFAQVDVVVGQGNDVGDQERSVPELVVENTQQHGELHAHRVSFFDTTSRLTRVV